MTRSGVFNTSDSPPRSGGAVSRLAEKLRRRPLKTIGKSRGPVEFAAGERQAAYDPGSIYTTTRAGKKIRESVITKTDPMQVYTGGRPVRWHKESGTGFKTPVEGEPRGTPAVRIKALRPLGPKDKPQYAAPKGMGWSTVKDIDIKPGETFHEQPVYERQRLNWKKYVRAQSEIEKIPTSEVWGRHKKDVQELYAGERVGPRELRSKTVQHIQSQMQRHRDYMAGGTKESLAIIRAKNASLESARAHPERMVEYKGRLEEAAKQQQVASKSARARAGGRLSKIAARGMTTIAAEHQGDWQSQLTKLHKNLQAAASPEETNEIQKQIHQHFLLRKGTEEIKEQARGAMGLITDKPYEHGGTPLSEVSISSVQDILQKGSKTTKPVTAGRVRTLKKRMDEMFERSASSGLGGVKKKILSEGKIFKKPLEVIPTGSPNLRKLGFGFGAAGLLAGGLLAARAGRKYSRKHELKARLREIRFALPPESEKALTDYAKRIFEKAAKTGMSTSTEAIPGTIPETFKPLSTSQIAKQKWEKMVKAFSGSKVETLHPMDMQKVRALQESHVKNLDVIKQLREQVRTKEHLGEEALKAQAESIGAQQAGKEKDIFSRAHKIGREEGFTASRTGYEKKAGELTEALGQASNKRAGRLKLIAAGTAAAGGLAGYALGRHDKAAYQRHEARQILDLYKPKQPRVPKSQQTLVTIGISGAGGQRRKEVAFSSLDTIRQKLSGEHEEGAAHDIAIGALEGGAAYPISDFLIRRFAPKGSGIGRKIAVGGLVGGAATGLVGLGLSRILRGTKKIKGKQTNMSSGIRSIQFAQPNQRTLVARDRYTKQVYDRDIERADKLYAKTALLGAGIGVLAKPSQWRRSALKGAAAGLGVQKVARLYGKTTRDQFGERSWSGKRVERAPAYIGTAALGGYALKRLGLFSSKSKLIKFQQDPDEGPEWLQDWAHRKLYGRSYSTIGQVQRVKKYAGRTHRLVRDLNTKRQGLPNIDPRGRPRKNEWEKPWVAGALSTAGLFAAYKGARATVNFLKAANPKSRVGQLVQGFTRGAPAAHVPGLGKVGGFVHETVGELKRLRDKPMKGPLKYEHSKMDPITGKRFTESQIEKQASESKTREELEKIAQGKKYKAEFSSRLKEIRFQKTNWVDNPLYPEDVSSSVQHVPIKNIVSHQDAVKEHIVKKYKKKPGRALPTLHKVGKKYYVEDGNHRIVSRMEKGDTTVRARVLEMQKRLREIRFAETQPKRKHNVGAGLAVAAAGLPLYKGAGKFARAGLRGRVDAFMGKPHNYGKQVADYLEASQHVLNQGVTGKLVGAALRNPAHPLVKKTLSLVPAGARAELGSVEKGLSPATREHFGAFRSGHTEALNAWSGELIQSAGPKLKPKLEARTNKLLGHLQDLWSHGYNEREALRHVAQDPTHREILTQMAKYKTGVTRNYAKVVAGAAAVPATAGLTVAATTRKEQK